MKLAPSQRLLGEVSGAVADLGVMLPLMAALVIQNGFDAPTILVCVGAAYIASGAYFRIPVPVQPIKATAALTLALRLDPEVLIAAGLIIGSILFVAGATGLSRRIGFLFASPVVRALQFGVGLILLRSAADLVMPDAPEAAVVAVTIAVVLTLLSRRTVFAPLTALIVICGVTWSILRGNAPPVFEVGLWAPDFEIGSLFKGSTLWTAMTILVLPQLPLTFGNAVVAVVDLEHNYFGSQARRASATSMSLSGGLMNLATAVVGGMPMCHGSSGLTAHYRAGARTYKMNLLIGGFLLLLGLLFGTMAVGVIGLVPVAVLAGTLGFAAVMHASLVADLRGYDLVTATTAGTIGFATSNLALTLAISLALHWAHRSWVAMRAPRVDASLG